MSIARALLCAMVPIALSMEEAQASKWTAPTLLVVEARGFKRIPCPRNGLLRVGKDGPAWVLPEARFCLKARWRLLEAHNQWPQAMTDAFLERMGRYVYLSALEVPSGPVSLLLAPGPVYGKHRPVIVGAKMRARLLGADERFAQPEVNLLRLGSDRAAGDTLRLELRWSTWKRGSIAAGPDGTTDLTLLLRRSCLPGPVDLGRCATDTILGRSGSDAISSTNKVKGVLAFASPPSKGPTAPFDGTLLLDVPPSSDSGQRRRLIYLRAAGGDLEEVVLPAELSPVLASMGPGAGKQLTALVRCQQAVAGLAKAPSALGERTVARVCADLYREPACAQAMRNHGADPSTSPATIARACRDAYCPRLTEPRPALCQRSELPLPTRLLAEFGELMRRILAFELGVSPALWAPPLAPPSGSGGTGEDP